MNILLKFSLLEGTTLDIKHLRLAVFEAETMFRLCR
jgi:hypothetical protein